MGVSSYLPFLMEALAVNQLGDTRTDVVRERANLVVAMRLVEMLSRRVEIGDQEPTCS